MFRAQLPSLIGDCRSLCWYYEQVSNFNTTIGADFDTPTVSAKCKECNILQKFPYKFRNNNVIMEDLLEFCKDHQHNDGLKRYNELSNY